MHLTLLSQNLNEPVGKCKYSDITVFSTHPVKIITTIEIGIATTNEFDKKYSITFLQEITVF